MNEDKLINEQELDKVAGGIGGDGFEEAWAAYASSHCDRCGRGKSTEVCESTKISAAADWAAGQPIRCRGFIDPC